MGRSYQVHEFAELAGVTVKALHHYDRFGLLKPGRTEAGYRRYCDRDLEKLEHIVALKFLGFPLKQIRVLLERPARRLQADLRLQRRALEEKHMLLGRAIRAIQSAEQSLETDRSNNPAPLKKIIEVLAMQDGIEQMKKYYSTEEAWEKRRRYYQEGPSPEWRSLYRDVNAALKDDPGSENAQALAERWLELGMRAAKGDPDLQTDSPTAWMDREHWPQAMKQRLAEFNLDAVFEFMGKVAAASRKKYFSGPAWELLADRGRERLESDLSASWQARVDLLAAAEAALGENPAGAKAQELAKRWSAQIDLYSFGDAGVRSGWIKLWADRRNWPAVLRHQMEAFHMMPYDQILKCAEFIEQAEK